MSGGPADPLDDAVRWVQLRDRRSLMDAALPEALRALEIAGIGVLVLKGPVLEAWLYDTHERRLFGDLDLLVARADIDRAVVALAEIGYRLEIDGRRWPGVTAEYHLLLERDDGSVIEMHRSVPGVGVTDEEAWEVLWSGRATIAGLPAPAEPFRALHLALHQVQHGPGHDHSARALDRGLAVLLLETWEAAARLARQLRATPGLAAGLRMRPGGLRVLRVLGLEHVAATPAFEAVGAVLLWRAVHSGREGLRTLWTMFHPPRDYLAWRHPGLTPARARARHLGQLAGHLPAVLVDLARMRRR